MRQESVYRDINKLNESGYEILCDKEVGQPNKYRIVDRKFTEPELRILTDAVQAAAFISERKTEELITKIAELGGRNKAELLKKNVVRFNTTKCKNESVPYSVSEISAAIENGRKISFRYFNYDKNHKKVYRHTGNQCSFTAINGETKTVNYRKVYLKIPRDKEHFEYFVTGEPSVSSVMFFKDKIQEDMLPQLLRWLDYQCSDLADKLYSWGPSSAGLFNENDGVRTFKSEELANQMVYSTAYMGNQVQKYNLSNGTLPSAQPVFSFVYAAASIYHPKCSYDLSSMKGLANSYFTSAAVCKTEAAEAVPIRKTAGLHQWKNSELDGIEDIWGKRKLIEDQISKMLLMGSRSTFDNAYAALENILASNGWTKAYFNGKFTSAFLKINEDYLEKFVK